jgi:zinc and cadmium transporter
MSILAYIIVANVLSTVLSIGAAAILSFRYLGTMIDKLVPVSAGLLLATAITHLLPEAFHSEADPVALGWVILAGIIGLLPAREARADPPHAPSRGRSAPP